MNAPLPQASRSPTLAARPLPRWAEQLVRFLDDGARIPGTDVRFGADAMLGLAVPGAGDALSAGMALLLFDLRAATGFALGVLVPPLLPAVG